MLHSNWKDSRTTFYKQFCFGYDKQLFHNFFKVVIIPNTLSNVFRMPNQNCIIVNYKMLEKAVNPQRK